MSASTLSVTANPTRRRLSGDVKQGIGIVNEVTPTVHNDKDLSHSMRGEAVLERSSKDPKKSSQLLNSSVPTRPRHRKSGPSLKPPKPRWRTILSVLVKNFLLVMVLVGLVQMVRNLVVSSGTGSLEGLSADVEGRIASVESTLKTIAKMHKVEIEAVDKKVDTLVGGLRKDMNRRIEEKGLEIETRVGKLDAKFDALEGALTELKSKDLVTRDDLRRLYDELVQLRGGGEVSSKGDVSWDDIRVLASEIAQKEIEKHAADGLGMVDYALATGGAKVVKHSEPFSVGKVGNWFPTSRQGVHGDAEKMLRPSFGEPGQCFPLKGTAGFVQIKLRTPIVPEAVTLEHVAKSVAYDRSSAPKHCRISGWLQGQKAFETELATESEKMHLLTEFTYDLEKSNAQTFQVWDTAKTAVIDTVKFEFSSNHGSATHTCIYRLRVHGHEPSSVPMLASDS